MRDILLPIRARQPAVSRILLLFALLITGCAAWISQATLAFTGVGATRIALLPLTWSAWLIAAAASLSVWLAWRAGASLVPLALLGFLALPWISGSGPA